MKELKDLGFIEVKSKNKIYFCDCTQYPPDYYGTIVFNLENEEIWMNIRKEYYDETELTKAIKGEKKRLFKKLP